jgi:RHS repeat-associated protein
MGGRRCLAEGGVPDGVTSKVVCENDRLERQTSVTDAAGIWSYQFDFDTLALTNETLATWAGVTNTLARKEDSQGRIVGIALDTGYSVGYVYNAMGELDEIRWTVDGTTHTTRYSFVEGSSLIAGYEISVAGGILKTARSYEPNRDLIVSVSNLWDSAAISTFAYGNDAVGRRTSRVDVGTTTNLFAYNARSELTNALMGTANFSWVFDNIGNRETQTTNGITWHYSPNQLNQYTEITNGGLHTLSYDLDGNLLEHAGWTYAWDGENRLISASNGTTLVTFAYDHVGRRIEKEVSENVGGQWSVVRSHSFLYDRWNLIQERITDDGSLTTNSYIWGLDLSGSLQEAGGIGGLLCVVRDGAPYFPVCDANGNITEYVDATGQIVAHYEYGAFGELLASSGDKKDDFSLRFSSKFCDQETGLGYWGYRYYAPLLGRWLTRDPIGEEGGGHLYGFVLNTPIDLLDGLGFAPECITKTRREMESWFVENGIRVDSRVRRSLDKGCQGLTCLETGDPNRPERYGDSTCWMLEDEAQKSCDRCKKAPFRPCCVVFAIQGKWQNDAPPKKKEDGSVSCYAVVGVRNGNDWNYVLSKNGWYLYANGSANPDAKPREEYERQKAAQRFSICRTPPSIPGFPATIWASKCVQNPKRPVPTP